MENKNNSQNRDYDEIDLRQLADALMKRKKTIIFFTVAAAVIAFGASLAMPKVYRAQMALQIGSIDDKPIEPVAQVKDKLDKNIYSEGAPITAKTANVAGSNIITLVVDSSDRQGAVESLDKIGQAVVASHSKITAAKRQSIDDSIASLNENIKKIEADPKYMLASDCSSERYTAVSDMQGRVIDLQAAKLQITDTVVVAAPSVSDTPIKPNIKLNTIMAAILGLFFGIFAALVGDWWKESGKK